MEIQLTPPTYDGLNDGDCGWAEDGSLWTWRHKKGEPKRFEVMADHLYLGGQPLATGLKPEEMSAMLLWLMKDPRCTGLQIQALPPQREYAEWVLQSPAPPPVETEDARMIADAGHVVVPNEDS